MEDDNEIPQLPADLLQLVQDFNADKDARTKKFEDLKGQAEDEFQTGENGHLSMELFGEDWNASQFWYTDDTARILARQLLDGAKEDSHIAAVSAPSVYIQLRNVLNEEQPSIRPKLHLFEYDTRFEVLGSDFIPYDYQHPLRLPAELKGKFDRIICDPPFLSQDCQTKTALTVRHLARSWTAPDVENPRLRFITCTGERMADTISALYAKIGVKPTTFEPQHGKGLSNEFMCYANFESAEWRWR